MGYRVKGTLKLPDGTPGTNCEIEFTSRKNFTPMLTGMGVSIRTDSAGEYDVTLEYGAYAVILRTGNTYPTAIGQIVVASDTVAGQDLPTLLQQAGWQPATPEYITQINTWLAQTNASADRANNEASRATTQADRAKSEADRAAQITGINTVMDAIALAALPLPDVWAPLSDSLRMITGYGREVKVGEDVVSQMVNFSRSTTATYIGKDGLLKTAAVNEPRFEKRGLLIEGQSTNLNPRSQQFNWMDGYGASPAVQSPNTDPQTSSLITTIDVTEGRRRPFIADVLTVGKTYTISFRAKSDGGAISQVASQLTGAVYPAVAPGEWKTYSFTGVAIGAAVDFQITGTSVSIAWIQVEELPFASSYIPTNGAAATRVADRAYILWENNMPLSVADAVSFAVEATPYKSTAPDFRTILDLGVASASISIGSSNTGAWIGINNKTSTVALNSNEVTRRLVARYDGSFLTVGNNGAIGTPTAYTADGDRPSTRYMRIGTWSSGNTGFTTTQYGTYRCIWGHIRNIRIWHSALTDEQIKAIR